MEKFTYTEEYEEMIQKIVKLRIDTGLSETDFANVLQVDQSTISKIEHCVRELHISELIMICRYFKKELDYFITL